ncbi:MAG: helix-turn-helix transcriptional regulator [Cyanobacteria bacterium P01_F01_bin.53]
MLGGLAVNDILFFPCSLFLPSSPCLSSTETLFSRGSLRRNCITSNPVCLSISDAVQQAICDDEQGDVCQMDTFEALETLKTPGSPLDSVLMKGLLEGFMDGILIFTHQGNLVHTNSNAEQIFEKLTQDKKQYQVIDRELRRVYQAVIDSGNLYPEQDITIESELNHSGQNVLRIRARWLKLEAYEQPLVLIILEDQTNSIQSLVTTESQKYGLTPREAEIWLLRRENRSYKEIAAELVISLNTVKKHVKNIRSKLKFYKFQQDLLAS